MCGIFASITTEDIQHEDIYNALKSMNHRGPDEQSIKLCDISNSVQNIVLAHNRLVIRDSESHNSKQPYSCPENHIDLIFNGEIYNTEELAGFLGVKTQLTECQILSLLFSRFSPDEAVGKLKGMFSLVAYSTKANQLIFARDQYGIKPLYYTSSDSGLYIASEIKAFSCLEKWSPKLNRERAYDFLAHGLTDHTDETLFANVYQILPSHLCILDLKGLSEPIQKEFVRQRCNRYVPLPSRTSNKACNDSFIKKLNHSIDLHLASDAKLTAAISGGLDSSYIAAYIASSQNKIKLSEAFYLDIDKASPDEKLLASQLSSSLGLFLNIVEVSFEDVMNELSRCIHFQDEPFNGASIVAQSLFYKHIAARGFKVVIEGQGADEILGGYTFFLPHITLENLRKGNLINALVNMWHAKHNSSLSFRHHMFLIFDIIIPPRLSAALRRALGFQHSFPKWLRLRPQVRRRSSDSGYLENSFDSHRKSLIVSHNLPRMLKWQDRSSMAFSVESRVPFIYQDVVDEGILLDLKSLIFKGFLKVCLRYAMATYCDIKSLIWRKRKTGLVAPEEKWFINHTEVYYQLFSTALSRNPEVFENNSFLIFEKNFKRKKYRQEIWRIIVFDLWRHQNKVLFDS